MKVSNKDVNKDSTKIVEISFINVGELSSLVSILSSVMKDMIMQVIKSPDDTMTEITNKTTNKKTVEETDDDSESTKSTNDVEDDEDNDVEDDNENNNVEDDENNDSEEDGENDDTNNDMTTETETKDTTINNTGEPKLVNRKLKSGIKIMTLTLDKTMFIHIIFFADKFNKFYCKYDKYYLSLQTEQFNHYLKSIKNCTELTMYVDEMDKNRLVCNTDDKKFGFSDYKIKLQDEDAQNLPMPDLEFDFKVHMDTAIFQTMCKDMSTIGVKIAIICSEKKITFSCKGPVSEMSRTFTHKNQVRILASKDKNTNEPKIVKEIFAIKNLTYFNKCHTLSPKITLLLQNKNPLFLIYNIGAEGEMTIAIGPQPENDQALDVNNKYDDSQDKYYEK